ncbi:hypothetical protein K449DRAFT_386562 [Hypoxylon sp. EC38]|nr:hypothetical protein K449DRAFT_386562 [Hypoxylon sp. EC38]
MTRERKKAPAPVRGVRALTRRAKLERAQQQLHDDTWRNLNPLKEPPKMKHKTTFELVENTDKKKKLEFQITTDRHPPPGFEFVPVGHPELSQMCKEMSREQGAMIFIVSDRQDPDDLGHHMNRVGYHFRQIIVDQARSKLEASNKASKKPVPIPYTYQPGGPEPIPQTQAEIDAQADAVLRDLFPRIPHTDRRQIIEHAFRKDGKFHGESRVGMVKELTLARRVQLAAIAHIRHTHTRYDELLKEAGWANARKAVEKPCLDIIVKWRGDEETGRDQLDEILREVIEISDTEEESEEETPSAEHTPAQRVSTMPRASSRYTAGPMEMGSVDQQLLSRARRRGPSIPGTPTMSKQKAITRAEKRSARKTQRFRRYAAAAEALAGSAGQAGQAGHTDDSNVAPFGTVPMDLTRSPGSAHIIDSSREPTVAARGTPNLEQMPRHYELRTDLPRTNSGARREMMPTIPHGYAEANGHASPQVVYNPENHGPKVGPVPTSYHPHAPLSPVRHGLQDMLLQSIEPASPIAPRGPLEPSHTLFREPQRFIEAPRIVPRAMHEPLSSVSRPWSPRVVSEGNGLVTARHRGADYPENVDRYGGPSFIQVNRQDHGEGLRRIPVEYLADRPALSFRPTSGFLPRHEPRQVPSEGISHYNGDVSHRTRANPIVIDDDYDTISRPRRVVEVRRHLDGDYPVSFGREEVFPHPVRRDARMQDGPQVVYIDPQPSRPRSAFDYRVPLNPPSHGVSPYQEPDIHRMPASRLRHHLDPVPNHEPSHYRDPLRNQHLVLDPVEPRSNVFRERRVVPPGLDQPELHYANTHQHFQERSNFAPIPNPHQDRQDIRYHRMDEPGQTMLPPMEYRQDRQPPFVAPPPHNHYINNHESPLRYHAPEQRMVYVDR